ncbi:hypothetical protein DdX_13587 [Ditylenchus destructor]|uniref:Uncharacterized protein n=1 Tax=Ditylenchus destructor TaxID=166010 RepID=A0AAD4QWD2_9BILA|nr:hypothetical protein DdX_13587 [Ditylenchus destructor]
MSKAGILFCLIISSTLELSNAAKTIDKVQEEIKECIEDFGNSQFKECLENTVNSPYCDETYWYFWGRRSFMSEPHKVWSITSALTLADLFVHTTTKEAENSYAALSDNDKKALATLYQEMQLEKRKIQERYFSLCEFKAYLDRKSEFDEDKANCLKYATTFTNAVSFPNNKVQVTGYKLHMGIPPKYFTPLCRREAPLGGSYLDEAIALGRQILILCELADEKSIKNPSEVHSRDVTGSGVEAHPMKVTLINLVKNMKAHRATLVKKN